MKSFLWVPFCLILTLGGLGESLPSSTSNIGSVNPSITTIGTVDQSEFKTWQDDLSDDQLNIDKLTLKCNFISEIPRRSVKFQLRRSGLNNNSSSFSSLLVEPTQPTSSRSLVRSLTDLSPSSSTVSTTRVKRGHGRSYSTGIAYNRIGDSGPRRGPPGGGHGHENNKISPVGEDQTNTDDFKSYGVGYEHRHSDHCEESKCGYNIRHCPHGCVFNSFTCGGGAAYDTCCCWAISELAK
jgi:hypothetical protein